MQDVSTDERTCDEGSSPAVDRRVDLPVQALGLTEPPCRIQARFERDEAGRWVLFARTPPAKPATVARWLEAFDPAAIHIPSGLAPKQLRATFDLLPGRFDRIPEEVMIRSLDVIPDGGASLLLHGPHEAIDQVVQRLGIVADGDDPDTEIRTREARTDPDSVSLTPRQLEVLSRAVALGYYEIPHNLTLRELADRMDLTVGTVSELLRRAEARIITSYVDAWLDDRWNGETDGDSETWQLAPEGPGR